MPTEGLSLGPAPVTMLQNVTYALPPVTARIQVSPDTATMQKSVDGTDWDAMALTEGGADTSGAFVRCTTGNVLVTLRRI